MAASVTIHYLGPPDQKAVVKVGPMATLRGVLADAAAKWRPPLDLATVQLHLNKKPVDLDTPFRLLNAPSGSRLEVVAGAPAPAAAAAAAPAAAPPAETRAAASAAPPPAAASAAPPPAALAPGGATAAAPSTSSAPAAAAPAAAAPPAAPSPALVALGIRVPIAVFNQRAVEAAAAARGAAAATVAADPGDAFFEFTADDFAEVARAAQKRAAAQSVLMTRTAREAQARARAASHPPVPVRLHFPDGSIVQAEFAATQPVGAIAELARALVQPGLAPALYLYTAPPKQVLRDAAATLFDLRLLPAAHVHVGAEGGRAPADDSGWLRPQVAALMADEVPEALADRAAAAAGAAAGGGGAAAERERERVLAEARRRAAGPAAGAAAGADGEKKLPKWLKR
ncbi:hypothetical protein Rsub_03399 [Raphidocelis subcapitata]|uniref:TUG ubiquitin-like domain-containing protein n=1 Tax=Raphidocelis subcapitata TaxID=307507 RepID=A0A2V0NRJ7_9CHLO|nr:hypothetical protein Rsub_03399 [Raphidocelis subcapitata]|eukprot:GBF90266.1 hypothetical protein Rsub_03399 [Raphidocelis subcapitata]